MNETLSEISERMVSFYDSQRNAGLDDSPEKFYHGLVLGLIVDAGLNYVITSNRESGLGRYDVMMCPMDQNDPAYVLEFKIQDAEHEKTLEETVERAKRQIEEKNYDADLLLRGISPENIIHYGFAFSGKKVLIG